MWESEVDADGGVSYIKGDGRGADDDEGDDDKELRRVMPSDELCGLPVVGGAPGVMCKGDGAEKP